MVLWSIFCRETAIAANLADSGGLYGINGGLRERLNAAFIKSLQLEFSGNFFGHENLACKCRSLQAGKGNGGERRGGCGGCWGNSRLR